MAENGEENKEKKKKKSTLKKAQAAVQDGENSDVKLSSRKSSKASLEIEKGNENLKQTENENDVEKPIDIQTLEKTAADLIEEISELKKFIPSAESTEPYQIPIATKGSDVEALRDLDERKLIELKEAFMIFDLDGDGHIDADDLRSTFGTLGQDVTENQIEQMLSEAMDPLDFDAFVVLLGYKTIELDPEEVILEALSKWDKNGTGFIDEELIRHDLMTFGDKFTEKEAFVALEEAPIAKVDPKDRYNVPTMIDYPAFCKTLCGLRKKKPITQ